MDTLLTPDDINIFGTLIQYPVLDYLTSFQSFIANDFPQLVAYYSGKTQLLIQQANQNLQNLIAQSQSIMEAISLNNRSLTNYEWFVLVDILEQCDTNLLKLNVLSKWLRSTITNANFNPNPLVSISMRQGDTLESLERGVLGATDWDNAWQELALLNDLREEDYTSEGGLTLQANFSFSAKQIKIKTIVDTPIGTNILGIDLAQKLTLDSDKQDIVALSPQASFLQSVLILGTLAKGDIPEFPTLGLSKGLVAGSNINNLGLPALFRQMIEVFATDDTIVGFQITDIKREQDAVYLGFKCTTRLQETEKLTLRM